MQKLLRAMHKKEEGFTLVELMVVVVIIGVLVAIAIPIFSGMQASARNNACAANVRTIKGVIAIYDAEEAAFPANVAALATEGYLENAPTCPWDDTTGYAITGDITDYDVTHDGAGHADCETADGI